MSKILEISKPLSPKFKNRLKIPNFKRVNRAGKRQKVVKKVSHILEDILEETNDSFYSPNKDSPDRPSLSGSCINTARASESKPIFKLEVK